MEVLQARLEDAVRVMEIVTACKEQMRAAGSDQWDDSYPTFEIIRQDALASHLFVLWDEEQAIGAICLNEVQAPEYAALEWRYSGRILVVHRLCVLPLRQGAGAAQRLMDFAESFAAGNGYAAIRLDTYTGNPRALALYRKRGYEGVGQVSFPRRKLRFDCFEHAVLPQ